MRAFFAIDLSDRHKNAIEEVTTLLQTKFKKKDVHWIKSANFHITLHFLGDIQADTAPLAAAVRQFIRHISPFTIQLGPLEWFPTPYLPRIISLHVEPLTLLTQLAQAIGQGILASGYPIEKRPFRGHITLGKLNTTLPHPSLPECSIALDPLPVKEIILFQSKPQALGSRYTLLESFVL